MANSVDPHQTAPTGALCSGFTLFASILNWSIMLDNYLQQTTFSDAFYSWRFKGSIFFKINFFPKILSGIISECQILSRPVLCENRFARVINRQH